MVGITLHANIMLHYLSVCLSVCLMRCSLVVYWLS